MKVRHFCLITVFLAAVLLPPIASAARFDGGIPEALIMYDASKSMYPGYVAGAPANPKPACYHERAEFVEWLLKFMASQNKRFNIVETRLVAFYNQGLQPDIRMENLFASRSPGEISELAASNAGTQRGLSFFQPVTRAYGIPGVGVRTYLLEALRKAAAGREGIIWLITDNIVEEEGRDTPEARDLDGLFYHLREDPRYRSVHVFSYPYNMDNRAGALAVYGIVVSGEPQDVAVIGSLDAKFSDMIDVFPARAKRLKLRDLNIEPLIFEPVFTVRMMADESYFGTDGNRLGIDFSATITSNLTQHGIASGRYKISAGRFQPSDEDAVKWNVEPLSDGLVEGPRGELPPIPPLGGVSIEETLAGRENIRVRGPGFISRVRWAFSGEPITFHGTINMLFHDLGLNFEPQMLDEVYGMSRASAIFGINKSITRLNDQPVDKPITISVAPPVYLGWVFLIIVLSLLAALGALGWLFMRASNYRVVTGSVKTVVPLRPSGRYEVKHDGLVLGRLNRCLIGRDFYFNPSTGSGLKVEKLGDNPGSWRAALPQSGEERKVVQIDITALNGGKALDGPSRTDTGDRGKPPPEVGAGPARLTTTRKFPQIR